MRIISHIRALLHLLTKHGLSEFAQGRYTPFVPGLIKGLQMSEADTQTAVHDLEVAELTIERLPLSEVTPHPDNPRIHTEEHHIHEQHYDVLVRTPMLCQNGHQRWLYHLISGGDVRTLWGPRGCDCDCPVGEIGEGFTASGRSQAVLEERG